MQYTTPTPRSNTRLNPENRASQTTRVTVMRFLRTQMLQNMVARTEEKVLEDRRHADRATRLATLALQRNEPSATRANLLATHQ
jgi:hypothetical protein